MEVLYESFALIMTFIYEKESSIQPIVNGQTVLEVNRVLNKHQNPIPIHLCKQMLKNERGFEHQNGESIDCDHVITNQVIRA
ncbi:hypothetical protein BpHYR1_001249 [Brachionus plicatilis]|uniref:Uncharacterized protein n=1 Tax=Brachionus plicatilis TaxID=10195 RepID=A0A3M7S4Y9_BRAPC|nr:hypothetical protein BpHYR1_001249 [Brachionus plicatilis]